VTADDVRHCKYLLHHQFDIFHGQVSEVLLTYDKQPRKTANSDLEKNRVAFEELLDKIVKDYPKVRIHELDYKPGTVNKVMPRFFSQPGPTHDFRGAPIYGYLFGLYEAQNDYVLHLDSDMFFGGCSQTWVKEALEILEMDPGVLTASPLPGPPHPDGILVGQSQYAALKEKPYFFRFDSMSTRVFLLDRQMLYGRLRLTGPGFKGWVFSKVEGHAPVQTLELMIGRMMRKEGKARVDFLGNDPGLWSIHPLFRSDEFYLRIPEIIERVKENDVPRSQLGYYNFSSDFIDWSEAHERFRQNRLRRKILRKLGLVK
jgi:hypothetical protein